MAKAVCVVRGEGISGVINFTQASEDAPTIVEGEVMGLAEGKHGFHIHTFGDLSQGCMSAGPHFNPFGKNHGGAEDEERHVGDFGNLETDGEGKTIISFEDSHVKLIGPHSIIGRSVIIHAGEDDLGKGGHELSLSTGNSGARACCGVIGIAMS